MIFSPLNYEDVCAQAVGFMEDAGVPLQRFCRKCDIKPSTFYAWKRGDFKLSRKKMIKIDKFLQKFGYNVYNWR